MEFSRPQKAYRVGIDVGLNSVGLAAIEVDQAGTPVAILNMETIIHDGGIDPTANKSAGTRKAISGAARRMRRLYRQRRHRLANLDKTLKDLGWPIIDLEKIRDPWYPWETRAELLAGKIEDEYHLHELLSVSLRHMARHRGWRNPYMTVDALKRVTEPSKFMETLSEAIAKRLQPSTEEANKLAAELKELTVAEIVQKVRHFDIQERVEETTDQKTGEVIRTVFVDVSRTLRGKERVGKDDAHRVGLLESKIHQSDNVRELRKIWDIQELPQSLFGLIVKTVFQAKSPKGSAKERVAADELDKSQRRAEKASLAFQRYRIVNILTNLRIDGANGQRLLSPHERQQALCFLWNPLDNRGKPIPEVSWNDFADHLGFDRHAIKGTAKETEDGDRASARPPANVTEARILGSAAKGLIAEWKRADEAYKEALIEVLSNGSGSGADGGLVKRAEEFVAALDEEELVKLDSLKMPEGRAAYSLKTLRLLTERMLTTEEDLHAARKAIFDVPDDWKPTPEPIGSPVGNPAVDRVLKIVNRYLLACEREWGTPQSVNIEHTREGLMSERQAREVDRDNNARFARNREIESEIASYLNKQGETIRRGDDDSFREDPDTPVTGHAIGQSKRDIDRWRALTRQEGKCLYCGEPLHFPAFEMDHIVPRKGDEGGATNTQVNLAAVCRDCNHSKGKLPFAVWAHSGVRPQVSLSEALDRVDGFRFFGIESRDRRYQYHFKREVKDRLKRTETDDPIDNRSIESVGWMANELHHRVEAHFAKVNDGTDQSTRVGVFRGWITSEARKAAGIQDRIMLIGGNPGKNRLDRRHHAVDAATIAMIRQGASQSLTVQSKIRKDLEWEESKRIACAEGMDDWDLTHVFAVRDNLRRTNQIDPRKATEWKSYKGSNPDLFDTWRSQMVKLADLVQSHLANDRVPVFEFLRLGPGSSSGHEDTVRQATRVRLGDEMTVELIDRSASPQQWIALTHHPDFHSKAGLPADPNRRIRVKNRWYEAGDQIEFFPTGAGCVAVRGGYAELGSSFHHARIYRCTKRLASGTERTFYAMMRVYNIDLLPFRNQKTDLFTVDLPPQTMSQRTAEGRLREALRSGDAEQVGWIVPGDELLLDMSSQTSGAIRVFLEQFPGTNRWLVQGLFGPSRLHLRPRYLASEGAKTDEPDDDSTDSRISVPSTSFKILNGQGFLPAVDVVFGKCHPRIIRRNILGQVRDNHCGDSHLPVTWSVGPAIRMANGEENLG